MDSMNASTGWMSRNQDLALVAGILGVLLVVFVPLPGAAMDVLLTASIALSLLTLLTVVYVKEPVRFSVFPSVLLLSTAFRLALNIATTRMILGNAKEQGLSAAGEVVRGFGEFVAGNQPAVGFVLFLILVLVNFVVISKGATRISEVAARFTLDALPGRQMAIDADVNAGAIDAAEARRRRDDIAHRADFYGAMDGATKFIRGDAIAGLAITAINIVAGFLVGTLQHGMPLGEAARTYTILTIGDGLVSQLPALVVSIGAGLLVTRASSDRAFSSEVVSQVFSERRALVVAAVFLLLLIPTGLPPVPLAGSAALLGLVAWTLAKGARLAAEREAAAGAARELAESRKPETPDQLLQVDPLELEVGLGLVRLAGGELLDRIGSLRRSMAGELGFVTPPVRIRDDASLGSTEYALRLRGLVVARGRVHPGRRLAVDPGGAKGPLEGTPVREPIFQQSATWIAEADAAKAESLGYLVQDSSGVIAAHLREVLRLHAAELLTRDDVAGLVSALRKSRPAVVDEVVPGLVKPGELQKVLQNLLREGVSIRDLGTILEALGDWAPRTKDPEVLTEYVRTALARQVVAPSLEEGGRLFVVTLDPAVEDAIQAPAALPAPAAADIARRIAREAERLVAAGHAPVVLCAPQVRSQVRRICDLVPAGLRVLSYNEILKDVRVESLGMVTAE